MNLGAGYDNKSPEEKRIGATESDAVAYTMGYFSRLCISLGIGNVNVRGFSLAWCFTSPKFLKP